MAAWVLPTVLAGAKGGLNMFAAGQARGAAQRAGRTANQERVKAGKKKVRAAWEMKLDEFEISKETIEKIERKTTKQLELYED